MPTIVPVDQDGNDIRQSEEGFTPSELETEKKKNYLAQAPKIIKYLTEKTIIDLGMIKSSYDPNSRTREGLSHTIYIAGGVYLACDTIERYYKMKELGGTFGNATSKALNYEVFNGYKESLITAFIATAGVVSQIAVLEKSPESTNENLDPGLTMLAGIATFAYFLSSKAMAMVTTEKEQEIRDQKIKDAITKLKSAIGLKGLPPITLREGNKTFSLEELNNALEESLECEGITNINKVLQSLTNKEGQNNKEEFIKFLNEFLKINNSSIILTQEDGQEAIIYKDAESKIQFTKGETSFTIDDNLNDKNLAIITDGWQVSLDKDFTNTVDLSMGMMNSLKEEAVGFKEKIESLETEAIDYKKEILDLKDEKKHLIKVNKEANEKNTELEMKNHSQDEQILRLQQENKCLKDTDKSSWVSRSSNPNKNNDRARGHSI